MMDKASYIRRKILEREIGSCKDITPEQMEIISILSMEHDEHEKMKKERRANRKASENILDKAEMIIDIRKRNLLVIELKEETSVPEVFYKGEEVIFKTNIYFDWDFEDSVTAGSLTYAIERYVNTEGLPVRERLERHINGGA